jgi:hypothetical protein
LKRTITLLSLCLLLASAKGQKEEVKNLPNYDERAISFGICMGLNQMNFVVRNSYENFLKDSLVADVSKPEFGFHFQIVSNYRLGRYFDLRFLPGVSLNSRTIYYYKNNVLYNSKQILESNFLEFPLLLKYKAKRINNFRPYIITGANCRVDLPKKRYKPDEPDEIYVDLKVFDIYYEAGAGFDIYNPYFKLSVELRMSYGFMNMISRAETPHPEFQNAIEKLNSTLTLLTLYFE